MHPMELIFHAAEEHHAPYGVVSFQLQRCVFVHRLTKQKNSQRSPMKKGVCIGRGCYVPPYSPLPPIEY